MVEARVSRLSGLDGLRGLAALVVMLYHSSRIAAPALGETGATVYRVLADSPAKITFAGTEAVLVFFALSGLVVALPAFRTGFRWIPYYGSRLVRLFLPVWAALLLAAALLVAVPRHPGAVTAGSWVLTSNARELQWGRLLAEASLWPAVYKLDNVLWSLRWELLFSLLLPVFVGVALLVRRWVLLAIPVAVALSVAGRVLGIDALVYLPVFLAGTLLAIRAGELREWGARRSRWFWRAAVVVAAALLISGWLARPVVPAASDAGRALWGAAAAGAVGLVVCAVASPGLARLLSARVAAWLGRVSFSLYLVHVPVLATLTFAWGEQAWPAVLAAGIPASLILAEVFTRLVERPSHRLARRVRRALTRDGVVRGAAPSPIGR